MRRPEPETFWGRSAKMVIGEEAVRAHEVRSSHGMIVRPKTVIIGNVMEQRTGISEQRTVNREQRTEI